MAILSVNCTKHRKMSLRHCCQHIWSHFLGTSPVIQCNQVAWINPGAPTIRRQTHKNFSFARICMKLEPLISGVACSRETVLLRCLKSTSSFRSVFMTLGLLSWPSPFKSKEHKEKCKLECQIDMLKEAEEQRLQALAAAGHNIVSHNMCATIICVQISNVSHSF